MNMSGKFHLRARTGEGILAAETGMIRAAILASGNGSNAENIVRHAAKYPDKINIVSIITDNPEAGVIARAHALGIPCKVFAKTGSRAAHEEAILSHLRVLAVNWVFLAGYMRILSAGFISAFPPDHVVNIHPSLLPAFPGRNAYEEAFQAGVVTSGITLHCVDVGIDTGRPILQASFPRQADDTLATFRARGMEIEYQLYRMFIDDLVKKAAS